MAPSPFLASLCVGFLTASLQLIGTATAARTPQIDMPEMNITYTIGTNAELKCTVSDLGRNTVIWRRLSDPVPISVGVTKFTPSKKYRVAHDKATGAWFLFIKKLDHGDAGEYECRVTGIEGASKTLSIIMPGKYETSIEPVDSIIEAEEGDTVLLPCKVNNLKRYKVAWVDERGGLISFRKKVYSPNGRVKMHHPTREEWSLRVKNLVDSDFGTYTCLVNTNPVLTRTITLKRNGPPRSAPKFVSNQHKRKMMVKEGQSVTLKCSFNGYPVPKISWSARVLVGNKRVKKRFSTHGTTFTIARATPEDAGNYTCTATNGISPLARGKVTLSVDTIPTTPAPKTTPSEPTGPSEPIVYAEVDMVGEKRGQNVVLVCHSVGKPGPSMYWRWNGRTISNSFKYRIRTSQPGQHRSRSELRVAHLERLDYGEYECFGHNNMGHSGTKVTLYEI